MAHDYKDASRATGKSKFKSMLGKSDGAKRTDEAVPSKPSAVTSGVEDVKIMGKPGTQRLDRYARGGKVKKGGTTVNVIVPHGAPSGGPTPPPPAAMLPPPPMAAKPPMPMPPPGGGGMPMPPPGMGGGMPPPVMRARGGYIAGEPETNKLKQWAKYSRKNSYHKKLGGGIDAAHGKNSGKYPITAGSDSGLGRLQLSKDQASKQAKKREDT